VRLDRFEEAARLQIFDDRPARFISIHASVLGRTVVVDLGVEREDADLRQPMALTDLVVVEVVCRRDLHTAGAESFVDVVVGDHGDLALRER